LAINSGVKWRIWPNPFAGGRYISNYYFGHKVFTILQKSSDNILKLEVTNARKLLPHGQNFGLGCSKSGYNPWIIQK
jgi:hypothetical protein